MSDTTDTGNSYTAEGSVSYIIGITFAVLILLITLSYASYKCNRRNNRSSSSSPPENDDNNHQYMNFSRGVDEDVLVTFPVFVYSEDTIPKNNIGSGCSICLADYKPSDVVRLLPKCSHFFHRHCVDTWLKVHPSCPVCRDSPLAVKLSIQLTELTV
uniref:RING-H2 finger protein ATL70-like n=1 Tax=Erigeron canadensis TaxID=72917 RepID=UPI001CB98B40|nr:RING-H2 finger protein ATL70-like [Erigeron canadensis]